MNTRSHRLNYAWVIACLTVAVGCTNAGEDPRDSVASTTSALAVSVTINSVSTGRTYTTVAAAAGIPYYIDRTFTIASLSAALTGGVLIKTAYEDRNVTRANYLRFTPSAAATVYVAMDRRMTRRPGWLDSTWRLTTESFVTSGNSAASPMRVYAKNFGAVQVQLGGNHQSPGEGMVSNYVVVVVGTAPPGGSGGSGAGGAAGAGGAGAGGANTGGANTGGANTGGANTGGANTGGANTGGANTGGANTGGANTGGANTGGANTGGANTGGANTGGANTGGANTGGANTGGANTGGANTGGANTGGASTGGAGGGAGGGADANASLFVVAHPDDDLLFINPDIETDIQAGKKVRTVYTTSGDAGEGPSLWMTRESNVKDAYAAMAGVTASNPWSCAAATYAGKTTSRCTLNGTLVDLVFVRLPDGAVMNLITTTSSLTTVDGAATYTRAQFLATLAAIQTQLNPARLGTLDATLAYGYEHDDHIASATFAFDTARADGISRKLTMYRGYTIDEGFTPPTPEPANLTAAQHTEKARIFRIYNWDTPLSPSDLYDHWCWRFYPLRSVVAGPAQIHGGGLCLAASAANEGSPVQVVACGADASQSWTLSGDGRVLGLGGRCLGVAASGTQAVIETCTGAVDQRWTLLDSGQLRGTADTCLTRSGSNVTSSICGSDTSTSHYVPPASQRWNL